MEKYIEYRFYSYTQQHSNTATEVAELLSVWRTGGAVGTEYVC